MNEQEKQWRKDFVKIESKIWTKTVDTGGSIYEYAFQIFKAAKQSCAAELAEKDKKIAEQKQYYESVFDDGAKRIAELESKLADLEAQIEDLRASARFWQEKAGTLSEECEQYKAQIEKSREQLPVTFYMTTNIEGFTQTHYLPKFVKLYDSPIIPRSTAELIEQARREENEACQRTCERVAEDGSEDDGYETAHKCKAAIRARMK